MGTATLTNASDTYNSQASPTKTFYTAKMLLGRTGGVGTCYMYVYFSRPFPLGATITKATLRMYSPAYGAGSFTLGARRVQERTTYNRLNWNNKPAAVGGSLASVTRTGPLALGSPWEIDVTAQMQAVSDGDEWYGWQLELNSSTARSFYSAGATPTAYRPALDVEWSDAPDQPSELSPDGGRAVSKAKPTLRFDYVDVSGSTQIAAVQVQIDPNAAVENPAFDSGIVPVSVPELDLTQTDYPGLDNGSLTQWRVRVQDGDGLWSTWSQWASFSREPKLTVVIDNPAEGVDDEPAFVTEPTPPVFWTVTGGTQVAYQVIVTDSEETSTWLYSSGKITSADNAITLPAKVIATPNEDYDLVIRAWDGADREATPGDPVYTQARRTFVYLKTATLRPTTDLVATPLTPTPWVDLEWKCATAPDSFSIEVNGTIEETDLDPAELFVSGTSYKHHLRYLNPRRPNTIEVVPVVNGKAQSGNAKIVVTTEPVGIWLTESAYGHEVCIADVDEGTWEMGEVSEAHEILGATHKTLVTQALRGYEGTVEGTIYSGTSLTNLTAQQLRDRMFRIKQYPGITRHLVLSDINIPVILQNVNVQPTPAKELNFKVSFDFFALEIPFKVYL